MRSSRKLIFILSLVLACPFLAYGVVGLMRWAGADRLMSGMLGVTLTDDPILSVGYIVIGCGIFFLLKLMAERT